MPASEAEAAASHQPKETHIRRALPEDWEGIAELHRRHYWRPYCLLLNRAFYDWQFEAWPRRSGRGDASLVALDSYGRVLSFLGVVEMAATSLGQPLRAAHLISWLSDPAAQGVGLGLRMMRQMTDEYEFLFGRSVTPAALSVYRKLGFRYFNACSRWVAVIDAEAALSLAADPSIATKRRLRARQLTPVTASRGRLHSAVPEELQALQELLGREATAFDRSADFLGWRYGDHPYLTYGFLTVGDPCEGLAVVRVERVRGSERYVLRVVEFVATVRSARALGEAVVAHAAEARCAYLDAFGMSERHVQGLIAAGAFLWTEEPDVRLPHRLQPVEPEMDPPGLLFFGKPSGVRHGLPPHCDISSLYVSKGDGNLDWPSWTPGGDPIAPPVPGYSP